jgi:hypothetical protein
VLNYGLALDSCIPYTSGGGTVPPCPTLCKDNSTIVRTKATRVYDIKYAGLEI